jgi:hypothetical protein
LLEAFAHLFDLCIRRKSQILLMGAFLHPAAAGGYHV